jgi:hypothetical protein
MFNGEIAACAAAPALGIDKGALMTVTFPNQLRNGDGMWREPFGLV